MKANSITVILMTFIVSVTAFANERQRMCHVALDDAAPDRMHVISKEVDVTN